jgi:hypothetical protein
MLIKVKPYKSLTKPYRKNVNIYNPKLMLLEPS